MTETMAIDQHGHTEHGLGAHPRQALLSRLCRKGARKMYCDYRNPSDPEGTYPHTRHTGYIIGGRWLTLYNVTAWKGRA